MSVKNRRLFEKFHSENLKITWLIFLFVLGFVLNDDKSIMKSSENRRILTYIGFVGVLIFGSIFYVFIKMFTDPDYWPIEPIIIYMCAFFVDAILLAFSINVVINNKFFYHKNN
jgi:hypothetical protein